MPLRTLPIVLLALLAAGPARALAPDEVVALLQRIDDRQRNSGDYKSLAYVEARERGKSDRVLETVIYRRDEKDQFMILILKPKSERGKGYLRLDRNLWMYDPGVGKWERRTERERIAGTDSRRTDFDESRLAEEYDAVYVGQETLGRFTVHHLRLTAKNDADVAYPVSELWVDTATENVLKHQEFAASGKLMRTTYTPKWSRLFSESKGSDIWYPAEIRIYDEVEKDNSTLVIMKSVDLRPLPENIFTKAWLESKSR
ncbi:MAG: outer membrane lipoprotein-sorting protein [Deltaproteobacteria bacterium]|nr:outer membrane lipoprotein-sorting protein [Deltaproteobacteria bacterium]